MTASPDARTESASTPGDATPGDATPGDATPGDATPGDATPGDATPATGPAGHVAPVVIDGRALAANVREDVRRRAAALRAAGRPARLDAILACGDDGAEIYARKQASTCEDLGIEYRLHELSSSANFEDVAGRVLLMNEDDAVTAIMIHLPLPPGVDTERIQSLIDVDKDVEGVNPANIGNVVYGRRSLVPCTALAVMEMIESTGVELRGARCVVVGASNIVGKPIAVLLMRAGATVVSTNVHTRDQAELTRLADVLIAAVGKPDLITADMVKPGATVIDVGVNRVKVTLPDGTRRSRTVGDVAYDAVSQVAGAISPVPGGVGPMTVAMLLRNTVDAAEH
ncbi:MAG: tetrahydrofolate dehydrogenase/cyclohydrolase catalytic domain-containing protein [Phycisphaerales bacterium]